MKNIVIMGPPGSGKDTQITELKGIFDFAVISAGDIARELGRKDPKIMEKVNHGDLINDDLILAGASGALDLVPSEKGIIFDGFPRTVYQAEKFNEIMLHHNRTLEAVVYLDLDEEEVVKRLTNRLVCPMCGSDLNPGETKCAKDGSEGVRRKDDEPATIINRMQTYLDRTVPLVDYYRTRGVLNEINGNQSIEKVADDIKEKLGLCQKIN